MPKMSRRDHGQMLQSRIDGALNVYRRNLPTFRRLEEALAGRYPTVMPGASPVTQGQSEILVNDQINLNMLLSASNYMTALAYDEFPSFRFGRRPDEPEEVCVASERLIEMLLDEGDAMAECRRAMRYLMTRGSWIMWVYVGRQAAMPSEVTASAQNPADFVQAARMGALDKLPEGADYFAIAQAARSVLSPEFVLGMKPDEAARIAALAEAAEVAHAKSLTRSHSRYEGRIVFEAAPYGTWTVWDPTCTDVRRADWIARKIVMDHEDFLDDPSFTDEAKKNVTPVNAAHTGDPALSASAFETSSERALEETGRVVLWEYWSRKTWKRHYLADCCEGTIEVDDRYPYLDEEGKPLFKDFYPCAIRTPLMHNMEVPDQSLGIPWLAPGWPQQIELIRTRTAYYQACKRSARIGVAASGIDDATVASFTAATDGGIIRPTSSYDRSRDGELFKLLDTGQAPTDYLIASTRLMADLANQLRIPLGVFTGEPVADTLGQEEIAVKGSSITQGDFVRALESGTAEIAFKALTLFKHFASDPEKIAYMGKGAVQPISAQDGRTLLDAFNKTSFEGRKLSCRFASSTRAEDAVRLKQRMDFYALSMGPLGRDSTGMPFFDGRSQLIGIAKEADIDGLVPYQPSEAEMIAAALTKMAAAQGGGGPPNDGGDREAPGGGRTDGRKAGGQRGPADVPGRQSRGREPATSSNLKGQAMRPATATS